MVWVRWRVAFCDSVHCSAKLKSRELPFAWIHFAVCKIHTSCCIQEWLSHTFSYPLLFSIIHNREHKFSYKSMCFWQSLPNKLGHCSISRHTCSRPLKLYLEYILGTFFLYCFMHIVISSLFCTSSNGTCYFSHSFLIPDWHLSQVHMLTVTLQYPYPFLNCHWNAPAATSKMVFQKRTKIPDHSIYSGSWQWAMCWHKLGPLFSVQARSLLIVMVLHNCIPSDQSKQLFCLLVCTHFNLMSRKALLEVVCQVNMPSSFLQIKFQASLHSSEALLIT